MNYFNSTRLNQFKKGQGFTMAELIIVIAILAVLIVYLVRNFGVRSDDAKIAMVGNILTKDVPAAFQAFILENNGCINPGTNNANFENFLNDAGEDGDFSDSDDEFNGRKLLIDNGIPAGTPWRNAVIGTGTDSYAADYTLWTAEFVPSGTTSSYLDIRYPLTGVGNPERALNLLQAKLRNSSEIHSLDGEFAAGGAARQDIEVITAGGTANAGDDSAAENTLSVRYTCS